MVNGNDLSLPRGIHWFRLLESELATKKKDQHRFARALSQLARVSTKHSAVDTHKQFHLSIQRSYVVAASEDSKVMSSVAPHLIAAFEQFWGHALSGLGFACRVCSHSPAVKQ